MTPSRMLPGFHCLRCPKSQEWSSNAPVADKQQRASVQRNFRAIGGVYCRSSFSLRTICRPFFSIFLAESPASGPAGCGTAGFYLPINRRDRIFAVENGTDGRFDVTSLICAGSSLPIRPLASICAQYAGRYFSAKCRTAQRHCQVTDKLRRGA